MARVLRKKGLVASHTKIGWLLRELEYSLQANRKTREGKQHADRDAQFRRIARRLKDQLRKPGRKRYPRATRLFITADAGGSNAAKNRLWKVSLQKLADDTGLIIEVSHFPPGTSKWNKIELRLFCHITRTWQGRPLEDLTTIVRLIGSTRTETGLSVHAWLDEKHYPKGKKVTDAELAAINLRPSRFHGEWNY